MTEYTDSQRAADAEALCNLWGEDPNNEESWQEAWDFAPMWLGYGKDWRTN